MTSQVEPRGNVSGGTPADYTWMYEHDNADHLTKITSPDPDGSGSQTPLVSQRVYDPAGNIQTVTDANTHVTSHGYDEANHLITITAPDPDGTGPLAAPITSYTYDDVGNLQRRTDANNHVTTYGYDDANHLSLVTGPDPDGAGALTSAVTSYGYDENGNRTTRTDANGNATPTAGDGQTLYTYDVLNRLKTIDYADTTPDVSLVYDANSSRTQLTDGSGTETSVYDALNRPTSVARGSDTFSYGYDPAGNMTKRTYPDGTVVDYGFDDDGRLQTAASGGLTTSYGYDAAANLTQTTLPSGNGHVETRVYDRAGRPTEVKNAKGTITLSRFVYTLDPAGNPLSETRSGATSSTTTYKYDNLDRITETCFQLLSCGLPTSPFIRWTYDGVGNRLTEARATGTTSYTYDNADRLLTRGPTSYSYDQNGNTTSIGLRTFSWDLENRLKSTTSGLTTITYSYNGDGKRLQASSGSQASDKTNYLWDTSFGLPQIALERDGANALLRRYLYGMSRLSMYSGGASYYYNYDRLGSVANLTSSTGASQWTYAYEPFGTTRTETKNNNKAPTNLMKFAGELLEGSTSLYHLRARQYEPASGHFLTTDPLAPVLTDPPVAAYVYAKNRPGVLVDPSGLDSDVLRCEGLKGYLECGVEWLKEGRPIKDYIFGLRNDPADVVVGTGLNILGVGLIALGAKLGRPCLIQSEVFHQWHCGFGVLALGGSGIVSISAGTRAIREAEEPRTNVMHSVVPTRHP
jgi:RHS repeat-associated protein